MKRCAATRLMRVSVRWKFFDETQTTHRTDELLLRQNYGHHITAKSIRLDYLQVREQSLGYTGGKSNELS